MRQLLEQFISRIFAAKLSQDMSQICILNMTYTVKYPYANRDDLVNWWLENDDSKVPVCNEKVRSSSGEPEIIQFTLTEKKEYRTWEGME